MHPAIIIGTVRSLWTWLWGRYHVPQNVFLVLVCNQPATQGQLSLSFPPGSVNEYQLRLGRQRQEWFILLRMNAGQLVKYDVHTTHKMKSIHAMFLSHIIILSCYVLQLINVERTVPVAVIIQYITNLTKG